MSVLVYKEIYHCWKYTFSRGAWQIEDNAVGWVRGGLFVNVYVCVCWFGRGGVLSEFLSDPFLKGSAVDMFP